MITQNYKVLVPSYGRDYKSKKEVEADFRGGKDFTMADTGQQCSVSDFAPKVKVNIRFKQNRNVCTIIV